MTKRQKLEMFSMRLDGKTDIEIAQKFGISRERVGQIIGRKNPRKRGYAPTGCRYPNIEKWMEDNEVNTKDLAQMANIQYQRLYRFLRWEGVLNTEEVSYLLHAVGMDGEQAFAKKG